MRNYTLMICTCVSWSWMKSPYMNTVFDVDIMSLAGRLTYWPFCFSDSVYDHQSTSNKSFSCQLFFTHLTDG